MELDFLFLLHQSSGELGNNDHLEKINGCRVFRGELTEKRKKSLNFLSLAIFDLSPTVQLCFLSMVGGFMSSCCYVNLQAMWVTPFFPSSYFLYMYYKEEAEKGKNGSLHCRDIICVCMYIW